MAYIRKTDDIHVIQVKGRKGRWVDLSFPKDAVQAVIDLNAWTRSDKSKSFRAIRRRMPVKPPELAWILPVEAEDVPYNELCPVCKGLLTNRCRCPQAHTECENGHKWHYKLVSNKHEAPRQHWMIILDKAD